MKKIFFTILIATAGALFADTSSTFTTTPSLPQLSPQELLPPKQGFFYVRFTAAESDLARVSQMLPGLGIGYRRLAGNGAADISFSAIGREHRSGFWAAPKTSYIHFLQPHEKKSAYIGGGMAWGGMHAKGQSFIGLIPSATAGYEFARKSSFLSFAEFTISQPALSVSQKGVFPGPCAEFSTGIGF